MSGSYEKITTYRSDEDDRIFHIDLDAVEQRNVLDLELILELNEAIKGADRDSDVQGIILGTVSDEVFCAGGSLFELKDVDVEAGNRFLTAYIDTVDAMWKSGKPVVAAVKGDCVAGGNELVMGCDLVIGGESSRFGQPEAGVGSTAAGGGVQMMPLMVGMQRARDLLLTGRLLSAEEALDWGLIARVVEDDRVDEEAFDIVQTIIDEKSPQAYRVIKAMFKHWNNMAMAGSEVERELTAAVWASEEFGERANAFLDKERPEPRSFTGVFPGDEE